MRHLPRTRNGGCGPCAESRLDVESASELLRLGQYNCTLRHEFCAGAAELLVVVHHFTITGALLVDEIDGVDS